MRAVLTLPVLALTGPVLALTGCETVLSVLEEQRVAPTEITWSGQILDGPYAEDVGVFTGGTITLSDHAGDPLLSAAGEALADPVESDTQPGTWALTVPVYTDILVRLSGEGFATTVWSSHTPGGRAYWYTGALFARRAEDLDATLAAYAEAGLMEPPTTALSDGEVVYLMAEPLAPDAWAGAQVSVTDGAGATAPIVLLTTDEDGVIGLAGEDDPISAVLALDLAPGDVVLTVEAADGAGLTLSWPAQGGDLLNASFLGLSTSDQADAAAKHTAAGG